MDPISKEGIDAILGKESGIAVQVYDGLPSTNLAAKDAARCGAHEGLVILADHQTDGYGRYGRVFHSPEGTGLYMSLLLRPDEAVTDPTLMTTAAAVAVAEAIEETTGRICSIKWVNDLLLDGKKVCGILTEGAFSAEAARLDYAVVGIGINVTEPECGFPEEIQHIAGALMTHSEEGLRIRLAAAVIKRFWHYYRHLPEKLYLSDYRKRLSFLGGRVTVLRNGTEAVAIACAVDDDLRLTVRYDDGREESLSTGEIAIRL